MGQYVRSVILSDKLAPMILQILAGNIHNLTTTKLQIKVILFGYGSKRRKYCDLARRVTWPVHLTEIHIPSVISHRA